MDSSVASKISQDESFAYNVLKPVIPYLSLEDVFNLMRVCKMWRWIIKYDENLMFSKFFNSCIRHLPHLANKYGPKLQHLRIDRLDPFCSLSVIEELSKMPNLRSIKLNPCKSTNLKRIIDALDRMNVKSIRMQQCYCEDIPFSFDNVSTLSNLTHLSIATLGAIEPESVKVLGQLHKLKHFHVCSGYHDVLSEALKAMTGLEILHLAGKTSDVLSNEKNLLKNHTRLYKIKLALTWNCTSDVFKDLNQIPNLRELELYGHILLDIDSEKFISGLSYCTKVKILSISLEPNFDSESSRFRYYMESFQNSPLHKAVLKLQHTLTHLYLLIPSYCSELVSLICDDDDLSSSIRKMDKKTRNTFEKLNNLRLKHLEKKLREQMPKTKIFAWIQYYKHLRCLQCKHYQIYKSPA